MKPDKDLVELRHKLHSIAETSQNEGGTAEFMESFLKSHNPDKIITGIGGHGLAAIYESGKLGPRVMIRCELDALPIPETIEIDYISKNEGASHKCGHDGHMTIVAGLASWLQKQPLSKGSVMLLLQPAEEIGKGAKWVVEDPKFKRIEPDYAFALHNLPGYPMGQVIIKDGVFAAASKGLKIHLTGATSHAAEPELGKSPALAAAQLIQSLSAVPQYYTALYESAKVTVIHAKVGEIAFGTSPGDGWVMATLRSYSHEVMDKIASRCEKLAGDIARTYDLDFKLEWDEEFPSTANDTGCAKIIEESAASLRLKIHNPSYPFPWSEDFGHFTARCKGALFGLGSGEKQPALHHPDYDFPDGLIGTGIGLFQEIINRVLNE